MFGISSFDLVDQSPELYRRYDMLIDETDYLVNSYEGEFVDIEGLAQRIEKFNINIEKYISDKYITIGKLRKIRRILFPIAIGNIIAFYISEWISNSPLIGISAILSVILSVVVLYIHLKVNKLEFTQIGLTSKRISLNGKIDILKYVVNANKVE